MKHIIFWTAVIGLSFSTQALTLDDALRLAAEKSPELRAAQAEAQAASADINAASLWANPELGFDAEGLGGDSGGTDSAEYSLMLSQEFPTSGKIRTARAVGIYAAEAARIAVTEAGQEFETTVRLAFVDVLAAQEILAVRVQQLVLAEEFLKAAQKRYEAGAVSELEVLRAEMMLETGRGEKLTAEKRLAAAKDTLARLTGLPQVESVEGEFFQTLEPPDRTTLREMYPALQRFQALEKMAGAEVAVARSARVPDVTLGAGTRYEEDGNIHSYLFSASIPLPLFNRGNAAALAAGLRAEAVRYEQELARRNLETERCETLAEFETASAEAARFRTVLLPKAERAVELIQEGYASGRYGWLERVEIQLALTENRMGAIEAQRTALRAQAQLLKFYTEN